MRGRRGRRPHVARYRFPGFFFTALFLAAAAPHRRDRIVVLEKKRYPREKICAGARVFCAFRHGSLELHDKETFIVPLPPIAAIVQVPAGMAW